jgi:ketosteroid isomerase-like protein
MPGAWERCSLRGPEVDMGLRNEIEGLIAQFGKDFSNQDSASVANFYAADAKLLPPGSPLVEGRDAIRAFADGMLAAGCRALELTAADVIEAGNCAIEVGSFVMGIEPPGADPIQEIGKYVAIYRRQSDGSLKMIVDTFNSDTPES